MALLFRELEIEGHVEILIGRRDPLVLESTSAGCLLVSDDAGDAGWIEFRGVQLCIGVGGIDGCEMNFMHNANLINSVIYI